MKKNRLNPLNSFNSLGLRGKKQNNTDYRKPTNWEGGKASIFDNEPTFFTVNGQSVLIY